MFQSASHPPLCIAEGVASGFKPDSHAGTTSLESKVGTVNLPRWNVPRSRLPHILVDQKLHTPVVDRVLQVSRQAGRKR